MFGEFFRGSISEFRTDFKSVVIQSSFVFIKNRKM